MKNLSAFLVTTVMLSGVGLMVNTNAYADTIGNVSLSEENDDFLGLKESDSILFLPDGSYIHGELKEYSLTDLTQVVAQYNSETDSSAVTVSEAREILKRDKENYRQNESLLQNIKNPRGTSPSNTVRELGLGAAYTSSSFTGNGWRFAGYRFKAVNSPGPNLKWSVTGGSGIVGYDWQAWNTYESGVKIGTAIAPGDYPVGIDAYSTFYAYNPINGTRYHVSNT
ncbi:MAG: hypothetical protein ACK5NA_05500 [Enterococcus sp.]